MEDLKLAVLIDADNISPKYVKVILDEAASFGIAAVKRIYGDWSDPRLKSWRDVLLNNSIIPMQQYSYTSGKNATDSAMIIDAMDLLYAGNLGGFCIVSSDSDFTRLAARLREAGKLVIGMGESKTLGPFVKACDQFKYLDLILGHQDEDAAPNATDTAEAAALAQAGDDTAINRDSVARLVRGMIDEMDDGTGWVRTSRVGDQLIKRYPDFDVRNFGSKSLNKFLGLLPRDGGRRAHPGQRQPDPVRAPAPRAQTAQKGRAPQNRPPRAQKARDAQKVSAKDRHGRRRGFERIVVDTILWPAG